MIRPIMTDPLFLAQRSLPADRSDVSVGQDLLDTLAAHREECVGMAANMIGVRKCVIVFCDVMGSSVMYNPVILSKSDPYDTEEGCLSLIGTRPTRRWKTITVRYQDAGFSTRQRTLTGFIAQIVQHEIDHTEGKLI